MNCPTHGGLAEWQMRPCVLSFGPKYSLAAMTSCNGTLSSTRAFLKLSVLINKGLARPYNPRSVTELTTEFVMTRIGDRNGDLEATEAVCDWTGRPPLRIPGDKRRFISSEWHSELGTQSLTSECPSVPDSGHLRSDWHRDIKSDSEIDSCWISSDSIK